MTDHAATAKDLHRWKLSCFPILRSGEHKKPAVAWKIYQSVRASAAQVEAWLKAGHNLAVATGSVSGTIVLDVDPPHGGDQTLRRLIEIHGHLPETARVLTRSGGTHWYFRHPGSEVRNKVGFSAGGLQWLPGLDFRGDGGYVVCPPSMGDNGQPYQWIKTPDQAAIANAPPWLLEVLACLQENRPVPAWLADSGIPQPATRTAPAAPGASKPPKSGPLVGSRSDRGSTAVSRPGNQPEEVEVGPEYALSVLDREVREVEQAVVGTRNNRLNTAAFALAQLVEQGLLSEEQVKDALVGAVTRAGWNYDDEGWKATFDTINSAFASASKKPRKQKLKVTADKKRKAPTAPGGAAAIDGDELNSRNPAEVAWAYARELWMGGDGLKLRCYNRVWFYWDGRKFVEYPDDELAANIREWMGGRRLVVHRGEGKTARVYATRNLVGETLDALKCIVLVLSGLQQPAWIESL